MSRLLFEIENYRGEGGGGAFLRLGVSENSQCDRQREIFALSKTFFRRNTDVFQRKNGAAQRERSAVRCVGSFQIHPKVTEAIILRLHGKRGVGLCAGGRTGCL